MNEKADRSAGILALFGRNATGGLIHYISRKPTDEFEAYGSVSYAEYDHVRFEGAAGGPLTDSLQLRISGFVNNHDPFVDNIGTGNDGNEADTWAVRGQALFTPTDSWSVFGQVEWDFTEALTVIAGLRYLNEEKEMDARGSIAGFLAGLPIPRIYGTLNPDNSPNARVEEEDVAGKIQLNWQYGDDLLLYAGVSRGVKAGGFNAVFGLPNPNAVPYGKETPVTYEVGFKSTLINGRALWNTSLYYYDYQDYQAFAFLALEQLVFNTDAEVYGVDSNLLISPIEGLDLNLGINIMDTEAKNVGNPAGFVADRRLPNAPDVQFTGMARYQWPLANGTMAIQGDLTYQSENSFIIYNDPANTIDGYVVGNARLSWTSGDDRWSAAVFVKNIGDKEYITSISNNASFAAFGLGHVQRFYARPRWVGGQVTWRWN